ncbi:hypothetical protein DL767_005589 [Monosporascus sp. MG133]|nr:hypothetical protein DL767_005589 [Monosporascus sp. MG133]
MPISHGSTIEEWGLTRVPDDEPPFLGIMKRLMGNKLHSGNTLWKHFKIMKGPDEDLYAGAEDAFEVKGKDFDGEGEITAELGQIKMLDEYAGELGGAKVEKIAVLTKKLPSLHFHRGVFMMIFLTR